MVATQKKLEGPDGAEPLRCKERRAMRGGKEKERSLVREERIEGGVNGT